VAAALATLFALLGASSLGRAEPASEQGGFAQPTGAQVAGFVVDPSGAPIAGAAVRVEQAGIVSGVTETSGNGQFTFTAVAAGAATVFVTSADFAEAAVRITVGADTPTLHVVLQPAPLGITVTVTASRGTERLAATPASTTVLTSAELLSSGGGMVDDVLRNTPGFSLNRRSSSRASPPPSQGVALRGIPGIGASRTLVLADGVPLNDPFGGWVYWDRIPLAAIDRVEVLRGAAGDLYGADAMGGVIQILTFAPGQPRLRAIVEGGTQQTGRASVFGGGQAQGWAATAAGEWEDTGGFFRVPPEDRGTVDKPMTNDYRTAFATLGYSARGWRAQGRAGTYTAKRARGTPLLVDNTTWHQFSGEAAGPVAGGAWQVRASGGAQEFFNNFSAISSNRNSERLTTDQTIPSTFAIVGSQWARTWGSHVVLIGGEGKHTQATVSETRYSLLSVPSGPFFTGGDETSGSMYGRTSLAASEHVTIVLGARGDFWHSSPRELTAPERSVSLLSPNASLAWQVSPAITVRTAAYRAYRTPTLDELHRGSRQGDVLTNPNPLLNPERLTGVEGSVRWARPRASARVTGFFNHLEGMVANITLQVTPSLITRQKQNVDKSRAAGFEVESDFRPVRSLTFNALAVFTASTFLEAPLSTLAGNRVPQMPRYQLGAGVTVAAPHAVMLSMQARVTGAQFDDDQNKLELAAFRVVDAYASRALDRRLHAFVAVENLFNVEYDVGRTPNRTVGLPRTVRGGLRVFLP
jgi:outer membrane receptor protein involved in Fe transport